MSQYVFNPFSGIPVNKKSHVRGWALHWCDILGPGVSIAGKDTDLASADVLMLDHGVNFGGSLNLFGGVTDEVCDRLEQILDGTAMLLSLDMAMPDYVAQLEKRIGQSTCSPRLAPMLNALRSRFESAYTHHQSHLGLKKLTIGDSHSTAFAPAGSMVDRNNGATLFGALKNDLIGAALQNYPTAEELTLVFGSIDLRHHIGRRPDPMAALEELVQRYHLAVQPLLDRFSKVEVCYAMPVEHEGRKIPQTGFYEGTPFAGSREDRLKWTSYFGMLLDEHFGPENVVSPPDTWYGTPGEKFADECMELSSSVHLSPTHYRRRKWGGA